MRVCCGAQRRGDSGVLGAHRSAVVAVAAWALAAVVVVGAWARPAVAGRTYLALGDSYAFGFETLTLAEQSYGDQGYVKRYADWLGTAAGGGGPGGVRPTVINLAVPGEDSTSFYDTSEFGRNLNLHYYNRAEEISQFDLMMETIQTQRTAGNTIDVVSFSLCGNDLLGLANDPDFLDLTPSQQQSLVLTILFQAVTNYATAVEAVRLALPGAEIILVGYFNPFLAVPDSPVFDASDPALDLLNQVVAGVADAFGARYVDIRGVFAGREGELSWILTDPPAGSNIHPTAEGYRLIGEAMIVPGPGVMVGLVVVAGWLAGARGRRGGQGRGVVLARGV
ncbi:MAG: SGNH/GDSL hydrolase family protein [Phycisphaeraceae bacterium]|nr:SGNH/GDSL hydrolase family protein [Phycisphaeraceae bacterium]